MISKKDENLPSDSYVPDAHARRDEQDISLVYKPGKEKDFKIIHAPPDKSWINGDLLGTLIVMVIFSWLILLGGISLMGIEINPAYIPGALGASLVFVFLILLFQKKNKKP